jgi:hypothetical protein
MTRSAVIGQRDQRAAALHQGAGAARHVREGKAGNIHGHQEILAGRIRIAALELILVAERNGVDDEVQPAPGFLDSGEQPVQAVAVGNVGREQQRTAE